MSDAIWFAEGDIKSYFPSVNHNLLMKLVQIRVTDPMICDLIRKGLKSKVFTSADLHYTPKVGLPQGTILSPLLSNIYLDELDRSTIIKGYEIEGKRGINPDIEKYCKSPFLAQAIKRGIYRGIRPSYEPKSKYFLGVKYIRYGDNFILGIIGTRSGKVIDNFVN